ncbi:MAG: glutamate 5-kinase [Rickettsiales bacterium]|nr:glutamate 5-kinase [Rickettsiales bacterium]
MQVPKLADAKRVVIKVGSLLLADLDTGEVKHEWLNSLCEDIVHLQSLGLEVVVVSSGGVTLGRHVLGYDAPSLKLKEKQAAAACGQVTLIEAWRKTLNKHGAVAAQILMTTEDTEDRRRYLNARSTINTLLEHNIVPIINENDTITTSEIRYGDNDRLAARVASMISADTLVLLSDIDGLYSDNPKLNPDAVFIPVVDELTEEIMSMAHESDDFYSSGGMITKLQAAQIAVSSGCHMIISLGKRINPMQSILADDRCTWFIANETPLTARKHWIANSIQPSGTLVIDDGAVRALKKGNSLLAPGVVNVDGSFTCGDTVRIIDKKNNTIAFGLTTYTSIEVKMIMGKQSEEIEEILGYRRRDSVVHRNDLVMD